MAAPVPYVRRARDTSGYTGRLSDLIGGQASLAANQAYQQGQNSAYMWNSIGQGLSSAVTGAFDAYKTGKKEAKVEEEKNKLKQVREMASVLPADKRAQAFREAGQWEEGDRVEEQQLRTSASRAQLAASEAQLSLTNITKARAQAGQVAGALQGIERIPDPTDRQLAYAKAQPQLEALLKGTPYEGRLPAAYSPDTFPGMLDAALTTEQSLARMERIETAEPGAMSRAALEMFALGEDAKPEARTAVINRMKPEYREEARALFGNMPFDGIRTLAGQPRQKPEDAAYSAWEDWYRALGLTPSADDRLKFASIRNQALATPTQGQGLTPEGYRQTEIWKEQQLTRIQTAFDKINDAADKTLLDYADDPAASDDTRKANAATRDKALKDKVEAKQALDAAKGQIQASYVHQRDSRRDGAGAALPPLPRPTAPSMDGLRPPAAGSAPVTQPRVASPTPAAVAPPPAAGAPAPGAPPPDEFVGPPPMSALASGVRSVYAPIHDALSSVGITSNAVRPRDAVNPPPVAPPPAAPAQTGLEADVARAAKAAGATPGRRFEARGKKWIYNEDGTVTELP